MNDARSESAQREAARVLLEGSSFDRARLAARALRALLADPNDTTQVFLLGMSLNASQFPEFFVRFAVDERGAALLREQPAIDSAHVDFAALRRLPPTTLGGAYIAYLAENGLDPDVFQAPPGLPSMVAFVAKRMRQSHDLWHVLTGYRTDVAGEIALQAFTSAQVHLPVSLVIGVAGTIRWAQEPRIARMAMEGYRRGRDAAWLPVQRWESLWERDLEALRAELRIAPARVPPVHLVAPKRAA
jgi:ubiquinone biosynthesis protein COQ4